MLYRFHVNLFARPHCLIEAGCVELRGLQFARLCASSDEFAGVGDDPARSPTLDSYFEVTFEQAAEALGRLPRLDAEPDGFFLLNGEHEGRRWQIDGHLFDFADRLHRVELHGACPAETFDALLRCFGWPQTPVAFELVHEGVALDETAFRQWAAASS